MQLNVEIHNAEIGRVHVESGPRWLEVYSNGGSVTFHGTAMGLRNLFISMANEMSQHVPAPPTPEESVPL